MAPERNDDPPQKKQNERQRKKKKGSRVPSQSGTYTRACKLDEKKNAKRTDAGLCHLLAVVREALEAAQEERARALQRVDCLELLFLVG
jgi:hypothetical protein